MRRIVSLLTLSVSCFCFFVAPVMAVDLIDPVSQNRYVSVSALAVDDFIPETDQDSDSLAAPDFGLFQVTTGADASVTTAVASSAGSQTSEIFGDSLQTSGSISASAESHDYEAFGQASGTSRCEVTFDVTSPSVFTLSGDVAAFDNGDASVTLDGPSGMIVSVSAIENQTTPVLETGGLVPGTYSLVASASGLAYGSFFVAFPAGASYDLSFTLEPSTSASGHGTAVRVAPVVAPNPFCEETTISHGLLSGAVVDAAIFDVRGRLVRELTGSKGDRTLPWDGRNGFGESVRPGVYFIRLENGGEVHPLKVTRIR